MAAFELSEARLLFEGEVAALAASQITDEELAELDRLLEEIAADNRPKGRGGRSRIFTSPSPGPRVTPPSDGDRALDLRSLRPKCAAVCTIAHRATSSPW